ncbi:MAG: hypothetical protein ACM32E_20070 [Gemmatimonadota bacterium]
MTSQPAPPQPAPDAAAAPAEDAAGASPQQPRRSREWARETVVLLACLAAGIAFTWPLTGDLSRGRLPESSDVSSYVWALWWVAHQVSHLGNPWFTGSMAAPVGVQLGFDTTMPLPGLILTPVTLAFGPVASFSLLTVITPGLLCYSAYRAARLWLPSRTGAIAAGGFFGLSSMLAFQDWTHLNIALGAVSLPATLEAAVRLRRRPGWRQALVLGAVLGVSVLVNQETAVMAAIIAVLVLAGWLARRPAWGKAGVAAAAAAVALAVASPQLVAMAAQARSGGAEASAHTLAVTSKKYGVSVGTLAAPTQRVGYYGLHRLAAVSASSDHGQRTGEGMPMFGTVLTAAALLGLAVSWRRRSAWQLALLWALSAWLALGASFWVGKVQHLPLGESWHGVSVSPVMPYTWLMRTPVLSAFREADRLAILGLLPAALLAGAAVDWLRRRRWPAAAWPAIAVVAGLAVLEAGYSSGPQVGLMPAARPALTRMLSADRSASIVVDVPFGMRGGIQEFGKPLPPGALAAATADGHPRAISYTSWVPANAITAIKAHPFYAQLVKAESGIPLAPARNARGRQISPAQLAAARADARRLGVGWALVWTRHRSPPVDRYLTAAGFRFVQRLGGVIVFRLPG